MWKIWQEKNLRGPNFQVMVEDQISTPIVLYKQVFCFYLHGHTNKN